MVEPEPLPGEEQRPAAALVQRGATLLFAALMIIMLIAIVLLVPVPYLVAAPGVAINTLGEVEDEQVIEIEGRESFVHDDGGLAMVTVQYVGGPQHRINLFEALRGWLSPTRAVLPEEAIFPPNQSVEEISEQQTQMMDNSQQVAVAAALEHLDIEYEETPVVAEVPEDMPATGMLEPGDVVLAVDGEPVRTQQQAADAVADREPGDDVALQVRRDGEDQEFDLTTTESDDGTAIVGILLQSRMEFPFEVDIRVGDIGGPSAGMMFSLGVIDRLTEEGLTGDSFVAGTGTITPQGEVGGVSGVAQKLVSAERLGAEYFLVAEESCPQTLESAAQDIEVISVATLDDALTALEAIRSDGDTSELPGCE